MINYKQLDKQDFHMHTCFCDGADTPENMVLSAIDKGLKRVGVCCHSITELNAENVSLESELKFRETMANLKEKYADKIQVFCGIEKDYYTSDSIGGFDYTIGSVHILKANGKYYPMDWSLQHFLDCANEAFDGDYYAMAECYYQTVAGVVEQTNPDIIGHIDLIAKFNKDNNLFDESHPRYVSAYQKAVDKLIKYNLPFEINMGAISRGYQDKPYPMPQVLEYIKQKGGKLILSSDSHSKENVAFEYDKWRILL